MVAGSDQSLVEAQGLADRLRDLRKDRKLTLKQLASVLSTTKQVGASTISTWENPNLGQFPTPDRLKAYARLFCTERSFESDVPRLLRDDELTAQERQQDAEFYADLLALRERAQSAGSAPDLASSIWHFPDGSGITIVGSDAYDPPSYTNPDHLNYTPFARYADLDALIQIHGEIRACNPGSDVQVMPIDEFRAKNAGSHVVIIGGGAADHQAIRWLCHKLLLPKAEKHLYQVGKRTWRSHIFKFDEEIYEASFGDEGLAEDIGIFARGPHPNGRQLTATVCNGITSRGVLGTAICFIDPEQKTKNLQYVKDEIGDASAYCVAMSVQVLMGDAVTPDLSVPGRRKLYKS